MLAAADTAMVGIVEAPNVDMANQERATVNKNRSRPGPLRQDGWTPKPMKGSLQDTFRLYSALRSRLSAAWANKCGRGGAAGPGAEGDSEGSEVIPHGKGRPRWQGEERGAGKAVNGAALNGTLAHSIRNTCTCLSFSRKPQRQDRPFAETWDLRPGWHLCCASSASG